MKCLKCNNNLTHIDAEAIPIHLDMEQKQYRGLALLCPHCATILSVSVDPLFLKSDTLGDIRDLLANQMTKVR